MSYVNLLKPCYAHDTAGVTEKVNAGSTLMVDSLLGDRDVPEVGLDSNIAPDDPIMCGRLKHSESLHQVNSLSHLPVLWFWV